MSINVRFTLGDKVVSSGAYTPIESREVQKSKRALKRTFSKSDLKQEANASTYPPKKRSITQAELHNITVKKAHCGDAKACEKLAKAALEGRYPHGKPRESVAEYYTQLAAAFKDAKVYDALRVPQIVSLPIGINNKQHLISLLGSHSHADDLQNYDNYLKRLLALPLKRFGCPAFNSAPCLMDKAKYPHIAEAMQDQVEEAFQQGESLSPMVLCAKEENEAMDFSKELGRCLKRPVVSVDLSITDLYGKVDAMGAIVEALKKAKSMSPIVIFKNLSECTEAKQKEVFELLWQDSYTNAYLQGFKINLNKISFLLPCDDISKLFIGFKTQTYHIIIK
jgi:hypothetical protein